jgi:hypothetical protein
MTTLRIVHSNPNPTLTPRLAPPLRLVSNRLPDPFYEKALAEIRRKPIEELREAFEWLEDHCWVLPKAERFDNTRPKLELIGDAPPTAPA